MTIRSLRAEYTRYKRLHSSILGLPDWSGLLSLSSSVEGDCFYVFPWGKHPPTPDSTFIAAAPLDSWTRRSHP